MTMQMTQDSEISNIQSTQPVQAQPAPSNNTAFTSATSSTAEVANDWLLPDGVHDVLFADADKQQYLRHLLINQLKLRGYELVTPPLLEFTETLLGKASEDVKRQTFKIIDQLSGRLMGVRADTTPQILRIDANQVKQKGTQAIARYCYAGHVVHTLPTGLFGLRTPLQLGAEIFGTDSLQADFEMLEVVSSLLASLELNAQVHFDLGHVAIFTRLTELANLSSEVIDHLMQLYDNKALPELAVVCDGLPMGQDFLALASFGNSLDALPTKLSNQASSDEKIIKAINDLQQLTAYLKSQNIDNVSVDLADLSGYHYHSGMVFNVYLNGGSHPLARGGRFDGSIDLQGSQDNERPAIGFSMDVTRLLPYFEMALPNVVLVDFSDLSKANDSQQQALMSTVADLRKQNYRVVVPLSSDDTPNAVTHYLKLVANDWQLVTSS